MLKEKLSNALGKFGVALWYIVTLFFVVWPLVVIGMPSIVITIIVLLVFFAPTLGSVACAIFWIWGLVVTIGGPQDTFAMVYYVLFALNVVLYLLPMVKTVRLNRGDNK